MSESHVIPSWRSGYGKIYAAILILSACACVGLWYIDFFERAYIFSRAYEAWQLDEIFSTFIVATFALLAVLTVHERQLRSEVVERKTAEKLARDAANYDGLTGIANRALFLQEFECELARAGEDRTRLALLIIDVDRLLSVNDTWGHAAGDEVLSTVAGRLRSILRKGDFVARLGSDEFAMLFPMVGEETDELFRLAERILGLLGEPCPCRAGEIAVTASIGIGKYPRDASTASALLQCAETAMRQAKAAGKNRYALYDPFLDAQRRQRLELEAELREGFERGEIVAFYQPQVEFSTRRTVGFEALARWRHPTRGLLGAQDFIPIVEDAGLADRLFDAMLGRVCADTRDWPPELTVAINLSPPQLLDPHFPQRMLSMLSANHVLPQRIELEITETAVLGDFDTARRAMSALKEAGVRISLDDFGTGFSSLRHLSELPIDKIKIDRSFICRIADDPQCRKIVVSMLKLGSSLGLATVAEGVETVEEAEWLRMHDCMLGQGYLFARPMSPQDVARKLAGPAVSA